MCQPIPESLRRPAGSESPSDVQAAKPVAQVEPSRGALVDPFELPQEKQLEFWYGEHLIIGHGV